MEILLDAHSLQAQAHLTHEKVKGRRLASFLAMLRGLAPGATAEFLEDRITSQSLKGADVLVLTTRMKPFEPAEIDTVVAFVEAGGGLFNLSNHDPLHVEGARLAARFGVRLEGGYFITHGQWTQIAGPYLTHHPILAEWEDGPRIRTLVTNTTDSIRAETGQPIAYLPETMGTKLPGRTVSGAMYAHAIDGTQELSAGMRGRVVTLADSGFLGDPDTRYPGQGLFDQGDNREFARRAVLWLAHREQCARS